MKIKNKFIIPVLAILVALVMTGAPVATVAADTQGSDEVSETVTTESTTVHPYLSTSREETTIDLDATINSVVSGVIGENAGEIGGEIDGALDSTNGLLRLIKSFVDKLIELVKKIGDFFSGDFTLGDVLGSLTTTAPETTETTAAE